MVTGATYTLPDSVIPSNYQLKLQPDLSTFTFQGDVVIDIEVRQPATGIKLNAVELDIQSAALMRNGVAIPSQSIRYDQDEETVTLEFGQDITAGPAQLELKYTGILNDKLHGFYRSQYTNPKGETAYLATTQFESTDARRALPCWDEPARKATFQLTLVIPRDLVALSNTPVAEEQPAGPGLKAVRFAETPVMSTYLLAFVVGDLTHIEGMAPGGTKVGVWTTRGKEHQGRFALDTSIRMLGFFNEYFGIPYPLEKLDHIAIPDFAAGAMENWGAITYRETALLVDAENSSAGTRQRVAEVVAHEMAHMWFGDLVTMQWWDDLWLNESFASWMGNKAVDWAFPDWAMWTQFVSLDTNRALSLDGLKNSHPIEQEVKNPAEVSQLFDAISYSKGASIIRMLEQFLGPETFRQGLHRYLSSHQYANARTENLWSALQEASGQPVPAIMDTWTKQMGYPVLDVDSRRSANQLDLTLRQERFVYDRLLGDGDTSPEVWKIPVWLATSSGQPTSLLMESREAKASLKVAPGNQWVKVNPEQTGFFRVNYSAQDWEQLVPAVHSLTLSASDRLGIQNDAYALSRAGLLPVTQFLTLAQAYSNENDASVWGELATNLREIHHLTGGLPFHNQYRAFVRDLFNPAAQRSGWDPRPGEGHLDSLLRSTVLSQAGGYGDNETLVAARDRFARFLRDPASVHPDLRGVMYSLVAESGDRSTYDQLWELERRATMQEEKIRLLLALARFRQPDLLRETLNRSLSTEYVRSQDTITVVTGVAANRHGRNLAWEFLKEQWPEFDRRYGSGGFGLMRLVAIGGNFTTEERRQDVEAFFQGHPVAAAERTIRQSLERIRLNIKWLERHGPDLAAWFSR